VFTQLYPIAYSEWGGRRGEEKRERREKEKERERERETLPIGKTQVNHWSCADLKGIEGQ
jgi:hypothetical protein